MLILVSNAGSTSLKFKLFDMPGEEVLCEGRVERVGSAGQAIYHYKNPGRNIALKEEGLDIPDYTRGIRRFLESLKDSETGVITGGPFVLGEIAAVGFKTVLARDYYGVHLLDEKVIAAMEDSLFIAPIHNAAYLEAIARFKEELPEARLVGVFETAFHRTIPLERRLYALPYEWYEKYGLQRLGYHSASHSYIARTVAASPEGASPGRIISCHLGGSCSVSAILDGKSVDNSFGFSLQTGVPHANRAGDIDPYILLYLLHEGLEMEEILEGFERKGGMMGLSGFSNDMRDLEEAASGGAGAGPSGGESPGRSERAALALDVFVTAVQRYIGQYFVELGGLDILAFTGGIGEKSPLLRGRICASVQSLGVELDGKANEEGRGDRIISSPSSKVQIRVIAANEELGVARETYALLNNRSRSQDA